MRCDIAPEYTYFGLRDYGTATWEGGDPDCDHVVMAVGMSAKNTLGHNGNLPATNSANVGRVRQYAKDCGKCGAVRVDTQIGLEPTLAAYVANLVAVFRDVWRCLRDDGTLWLNVGDTYSSGGRTTQVTSTLRAGQVGVACRAPVQAGVKPKDLMMVPARVALALQDDGWYLRSDIIWCLSGGARVYARTQKGEMPTTIKDIVRLDPATVQLWNGERWTQVLGWSQTTRPDDALEIELRSGERIGCTTGHEWPTRRGLLRADALAVGDIIETTKLPEPLAPDHPSALPDEVGWFVGLYIAEGHRDARHIYISGHAKEHERWDRLRRFVEMYHGRMAMRTTAGHGVTAILSGPVLQGIIDQYVSGRGASGKHLDVRVWRRGDDFLSAVLTGYLHGDGHFDAKNQRWRIGYCNNDMLTDDLRTLCARVGASIRVKRVMHTMGDRTFPGWRGEIRYERSDHRNVKQDAEIVAIRRSRARKFWDIGVADEPHLFALASGVLTHNSKTAPMPESVTDRPTSAHEHIFLLTKRARYFYDADAVAEPATNGERFHGGYVGSGNPTQSANGRHRDANTTSTRNQRNVWTLGPASFPGSHFAVFPPEIPRRCILAGTSEKGACPACGAPWNRVMEQSGEVTHRWSSANALAIEVGGTHRERTTTRVMSTTGWSPTCTCDAGEPVPQTVLDIFAGAGTTLLVADRLGRHGVGVELNPEYVALSESRIRNDAPLFAMEIPA